MDARTRPPRATRRPRSRKGNVSGGRVGHVRRRGSSPRTGADARVSPTGRSVTRPTRGVPARRSCMRVARAGRSLRATNSPDRATTNSLADCDISRSCSYEVWPLAACSSPRCTPNASAADHALRPSGRVLNVEAGPLEPRGVSLCTSKLMDPPGPRGVVPEGSSCGDRASALRCAQRVRSDTRH